MIGGLTSQMKLKLLLIGMTQKRCILFYVKSLVLNRLQLYF